MSMYKLHTDVPPTRIGEINNFFNEAMMIYDTFV